MRLSADYSETAPPPGAIVYLKETAPPEGAKPIAIVIDRLGGVLARKPLVKAEAEQALRRVTPGASVSVTRRKWRNVEIDVLETRLGEAHAPDGVLTLSARIPLAGEAIQVDVGGPAPREAAIRTAFAEALAGLSGDVEFADDAPARALRRVILVVIVVAGIAAAAGLFLLLRRRGRAK